MAGSTSDPLTERVDRIANSEALDDLVAAYDTAAAALPEEVATLLRGDPFGHPLHPVLVDLPIGFWTSATVLDLLGGRAGAPMARRLIGLGVLSAIPALASGLAEYPSTDHIERRRVTAVHAASNAAATAMFALSWRARRNHRLLGMLLAAVASGLATAGGALGGHMAFAMGMGVRAGDDSAEGSEDPPFEDAEGSDAATGLISDAQRTELGDVVG